MGGSTLFMLDHGGEVFSVEHNEEWFKSLNGTLSDHPKWRGWWVQPEETGNADSRDPSDPKQYGSSSPDFRSYTFQRYAEVIDQFADEWFDVVIVDGRARPSCALHAQAKVAVGGVVMVDNAERPQYRQIHDLYSDTSLWERTDCSGPTPYSSAFNGNLMYRKLASVPSRSS